MTFSIVLVVNWDHKWGLANARWVEGSHFQIMYDTLCVHICHPNMKDSEKDLEALLYEEVFGRSPGPEMAA